MRKLTFAMILKMRAFLLFVSLSGLWVAGGASEHALSLGAYIDPVTGLLVFLPMAVLSLVARGQGLSIGRILFSTGIPLGMMAILIGDQQVLAASSNIEDSSVMSAVVSIVLMGGVYGVASSAFGYLLTPPEPTLNIDIGASRPKVSTTKRLQSPVVFGLLVLSGFYLGGDLSVAFDATAVGLIVFFLFGFLAAAKPLNKAKIAMAAFATAGITSLIGLLGWYEAEIGDPWVASMVVSGPVIGLFVYISLLFDQLLLGGDEDFDTTRMNWHWVELVSFLTFMLFSPATLLERVEENAKASSPPLSEVAQ